MPFSDRLCVSCNYWTATHGDQCESCATTTDYPALRVEAPESWKSASSPVFPDWLANAVAADIPPEQRQPKLTPDEEAELRRQLEAARVMAAAGPMGPVSDFEAEKLGLTPEEVEEINSMPDDHAYRLLRLSTFEKLARLAGVDA